MTDVNVSGRTILSTVETINIEDYYVNWDDFGKIIENNISKFLKKEDESQDDILLKGRHKNNAVSKFKYL